MFVSLERIINSLLELPRGWQLFGEVVNFTCRGAANHTVTGEPDVLRKDDLVVLAV